MFDWLRRLLHFIDNFPTFNELKERMKQEHEAQMIEIERRSRLNKKKNKK